MTRWLVTGADGMLGRDVTASLHDRPDDARTEPAQPGQVLGLPRSGLDISDEAAVRAMIGDYRPAVVVNCAAWTAVDAAEADEASALAVNGIGARNLAEACRATQARMVHISTDYVFAGDAGRPSSEYDRPAPRTAYGRTKLAGEQAVQRVLPKASLILRTAWLYGGTGPSFVHTMMRLAATEADVDVVTDQRGQPTWTIDVTRQLIALAVAGATGIYHATSSGEATWFDLATEVFTLAGADPARVRPTTSEAHRRPAMRPANSVLAHDRLRTGPVEPIDDWRKALRRAWPTLSLPAATERLPRLGPALR